LDFGSAVCPEGWSERAHFRPRFSCRSRRSIRRPEPSPLWTAAGHTGRTRPRPGRPATSCDSASPSLYREGAHTHRAQGCRSGWRVIRATIRIGAKTRVQPRLLRPTSACAYGRRHPKSIAQWLPYTVSALHRSDASIGTKAPERRIGCATRLQVHS
jgi:hypothetical protein